MKKIKEAIQPFLKKEIPDIRPGDTVKVFQKIKEKDKVKTQTFEGVVIARKHGKEIGATITVRKIIDGVGVEKIFPLHLPTIEKIEIIKRSKVRRAKLYYLRKAKGKRARLKRKEFAKAIVEEAKEEIKPEETEAQTKNLQETKENITEATKEEKTKNTQEFKESKEKEIKETEKTDINKTDKENN